MLFDWPTLSHAVINLDDEAGRRLIPQTGGAWRRRYWLQHHGQASRKGFAPNQSPGRFAPPLTASPLKLSWTAMRFRLKCRWLGSSTSRICWVYSALCTRAALISPVRVAALPQLQPPPGRMQQVALPDAPLAVIDYAHTPDALAKALAALRPLVQARASQSASGKLWVVFGAGGDRDAGKRAPMGAAAAQGADVVVVTSDNPRTENAEAIASQVAAGAASARDLITVVDRSRAIAHAIANAAPADVVLIAGKGHETLSDCRHRKAAVLRSGARSGCACPAR